MAGAGAVAFSGWLATARASETALESVLGGSIPIREKDGGSSPDSERRRQRRPTSLRGEGVRGGGGRLGVNDETPRLLDGAMSGLEGAGAAAAAAVEGLLDT